MDPKDIAKMITEDPDVPYRSADVEDYDVIMDSLVEELERRGWNPTKRNPTTIQMSPTIWLIFMPPTRIRIMEPSSGVGHGYFDMTNPDVYDEIHERLKLIGL
jgi:hypothetical protein